ncbi:MAG: hypothetical protein PF442_11365 [Desulfobulbaceae bacterium]|nr:hypothetical protein [Desulfobulbaceae bacterium]
MLQAHKYAGKIRDPPTDFVDLCFRPLFDFGHGCPGVILQVEQFMNFV